MVRHLEHVDVAARPGPRPARAWRGRLDVAGQQHPDAGDLDEQHHAGVVGGLPSPGPASRRPAGGHSTWQRHRRRRRRVTPYGAATGAQPRPPRERVHLGAPAGGSSSRVTSTSPTVAPVEHPGQPVDVVGVEVGEHQQRHPADAEPVEAARRPARGSGPASTTTPAPGPARSTSASPWPTSQATSTQPSRRPAGRRRPDQHRDDEQHAQQPRPPTGDAAAAAGAAGDQPRRSDRSARPAPARPVPHADRRGRQRGAALGHRDDPGHAPAGGRAERAGRAGPAPARRARRPGPSTVAGPTTGATSRLATTATRLTWPEIAATTGVHASWAASGTATASATQRGSHRASASRQPGRRAPGCRPWRAPTARSPTDTASHGSTSSSAEHRDAERPRARAADRRVPMPTSADRAHRRRPHHARLGAGEQHEARRSPTAPTTYSQRPRTPHHRASSSRKPTTRVRLVPETASRWVSPVVRKSSASSSGRPRRRRRRPAPAPARAGSPAGGRRRRAARRGPRRRPATTGPGRSTTSRLARAEISTAGQVGVRRPAASRPVSAHPRPERYAGPARPPAPAPARASS